MAIYTHTLMECFNKAIQVAHKELAVFTGATATSAGKKGAVPAPASSDIKKFLCGDGTWAEIHRVGDIIMTMNSENPSVKYGGTWTQIASGRFIMGADSSHAAGSTGGNASVTLTLNELPSHSHSGATNSVGSHTHSRGTMNITGTFGAVQADYNRGIYGTGAFTGSSFSGRTDGSHGNDLCGSFSLDASQAWSGETSSEGGHAHDVTTSANGAGKAFSIQNPYLAAYLWQRTA